jgi:hypothetical protein
MAGHARGAVGVGPMLYRARLGQGLPAPGAGAGNATTCPLGSRDPDPPQIWPTTNKRGSSPRLSAQAKVTGHLGGVALGRYERDQARREVTAGEVEADAVDIGTARSSTTISFHGLSEIP